MKRLLLGTAAIIAFAAPAVAADLPARTYTKAPAYTAPAAVYNWTGFYIGGNIGGAFATDSTHFGITDPNNTLPTAFAPSLPANHASRIAAGALTQGMVIGFAVSSTTIVCGLAAATCAIKSSCL